MCSCPRTTRETLYRPESWHDLFVMIGTAAGSLVGLLFVVMSLHFARISERNDDNMRATVEGAHYNTIHLLIVLVEAAIVLTPQPLAWMGVELMIVNLFGIRLPLVFAYRYLHKGITISHGGGFPTGLILTIIGS